VSDEVFADFAFRAGRAAGSERGARRPRARLRARRALEELRAAAAEAGLDGRERPPTLRAAALARLEVVADTYLSVATPVQVAAPSLLERRDELQAPIKARVAANLESLRAALGSGSPATLYEPEGGWSAVLRVPGDLHGGGARPAARSKCHGVLVHPGYFFDFPTEAFLVVSLLTPHGRVPGRHRPGCSGTPCYNRERRISRHAGEARHTRTGSRAHARRGLLLSRRPLGPGVRRGHPEAPTTSRCCTWAGRRPAQSGVPVRHGAALPEGRAPRGGLPQRAAGRLQAVALLEQSGFTNLVLQQSGFVGSSPLDQGWGPKGLPASQSAEPGHSWEELKGDGGVSAPRGVLVTGGTGALGRAVVKLLLHEGARVAVSYRSASEWRALQDSLKAAIACRRRGGAVERRLGRGRGRAGGQGARHARRPWRSCRAAGRAAQPFDAAPADEWPRMLRANLDSAANVCRYALPLLRAQKGRDRGRRLARGRDRRRRAWPPTRSRSRRSTRSSACWRSRTAAASAINAVLPGTIDTPANRDAMKAADPAAWTSPEAIARVVLFLLSSESAPTPGALVPVDAPA
jgi:NAD(P)-dependent dehydrogenase (short-subunit alcohol dehydrogenase family)